MTQSCFRLLDTRSTSVWRRKCGRFIGVYSAYWQLTRMRREGQHSLLSSLHKVYNRLVRQFECYFTVWYFNSEKCTSNTVEQSCVSSRLPTPNKQYAWIGWFSNGSNTCFGWVSWSMISISLKFLCSIVESKWSQMQGSEKDFPVIFDGRCHISQQQI